MWSFLKTRNGVTAIVAVVGLVVFILPTPGWIGWPSVVVAAAALGRLIVLGDRRHYELRDALDLDNEENTESRVQELAEILKDDKPR